MLLPASRQAARRIARNVCASGVAARSFGASAKQAVVPLAALDPERESNAAHRAAALKDLLAACRTGSFTAKMAGYASAELVGNVYKQSTTFHALPDDVKEAYHFSKDRNQRGWVPLFEEPAYEPGTIAHVTSFDLARELPANDPAVLRGEKGMGQNVWPRELPTFRRDVSQYYDATSDIAKVLFQAFAEMLELPRDTFLRHWSFRSRGTMRLMRYPGGISAEEANIRNFGIAAHTDFEAFTLLHQDAPGLQLQTAEGAWLDAPVPALDECTVILGDMIEVWTNGHLKATRHRVALVPWQRTSLIRFVGLDNDALVQPLPQFGEPRYRPRTQAEHLDAMMDEAEKQRDEVKAATAGGGSK